MNGDLVFIVPYDISFGEMQRGEVAPTAVYKRQVETWILDPVRNLESQGRAANGMAAFSIKQHLFCKFAYPFAGICSSMVR